VIELSLKYNEARMKGLVKEIESKKALLDDFIESHNREILGDNIGEEPDTLKADDQGQAVISIGQPGGAGNDLTDPVDEEHATLSDAYYSKEREHKTGNIIGLFALPDNLDKAATMIAPELKINGSTVTEFIKQQKVQRVPGTETVHQVAVSIEKLLDTMFKKSSGTGNVSLETKRR
jgi:hypothetical protein